MHDDTGAARIPPAASASEAVMQSAQRPVVFIHGLWLHSTSWTPWVELFARSGYSPSAPGWPHEPETVSEAREQPEAVAGLGIDDVTNHYASLIDGSSEPPVIIGHSFGGLIAEKLLGQGKAAAAVAIDPAQIKGVLPLPLAQLRAGLPALGNPANRNKAVSLTAKEFRFGFGNAVSEEEADDTDNSTRGPLLLISGLEDHTVPDVVTRSTLRQYRKSTALTELRQFEGRGHSLTIDDGWSEVAKAVLGWLDEHGL